MSRNNNENWQTGSTYKRVEFDMFTIQITVYPAADSTCAALSKFSSFTRI